MTGPIDPTQLEDVVKRMRALGVTKLGDIELGPDPNAKPDDTDETQRTADAEHRQKERMKRLRYGASGGPRPRATGQ